MSIFMSCTQLVSTAPKWTKTQVIAGLSIKLCFFLIYIFRPTSLAPTQAKTNH